MTRRSPVEIVIVGLMVIVVLALALASAIHSGLVFGAGDQFPGAVIPEAIIAVVLAAGTVSLVTRRPQSRVVAVATVLFAIAGIILGITFTVRGGRIGDVALHVTLLLALVVTLGLLARAGSRLPTT